MTTLLRATSIAVVCLITLAQEVQSQPRKRQSGPQHRRLLKVVDKLGRVGFIDTTGKLVIGFDRLPKAAFSVGEFSEGLAPIFFQKDGFPHEVGYIDETGAIVITPRFSYGHPFGNGRARVETKEGPRVIDRKGEFVVPPDDPAERAPQAILNKYAFNGGFHEGLAAVTYSGGRTAKYGFIDRNGKVVIPFRFDPLREHHGFIRALSHFSEGRASVRIGNHFGYIDTKGNIVVAPQFIVAEPFSEGLASVRSETRAGYIDRSGRWVISVHDRGRLASSFKEGLAAVPFKINGSSKMGYINRRGKVVIPPRFDYAEEFIGGIARIYESRGQTEAWQSAFGYIDKTGKYIWEPHSKGQPGP